MEITKIIASASFISLLFSGCTPPRPEFSAFAQAGSGYAVAVDKLLTASGTAQVDSTSWTLVSERQSTGMDQKTYDAKNNQDTLRLTQITKLRQHARLLGQYFGLLESLSSSDAPERTKKAIEGVVSNLEKITNDFGPLAKGLSVIGQVAVDFKIRSELKDELDKRKDTIRKSLAIQEQLLLELKGDITHALTLSKNIQEETLVSGPLLSEHAAQLKDPEQWVSKRRTVLNTSIAIDELSAASVAATKMREAFEGLITGENTIGRVNSLLTDIEALLSIAESIKS